MLVTEQQQGRPGTGADGSEQVAELRARAGLYRLCGRLLEAEIDSELLTLLRGPLRQPLTDAGVAGSPAFFEEPADTALERLAEEYTCLFVAPGAVMPYASVFETGRMFQEQADRALEAYRQAGWDFRHRLSGEFPDHAGVMLSFYGILLEQQADALEAGDQQTAAERAEQARSFLTGQMARWMVGWARLAARAAEEPFYAQLLTLIADAVWADICEEVRDREQLKELAALNNREPPRLDYDADFRKASGL